MNVTYKNLMIAMFTLFSSTPLFAAVSSDESQWGNQTLGVVSNEFWRFSSRESYDLDEINFDFEVKTGSLESQTSIAKHRKITCHDKTAMFVAETELVQRIKLIFEQTKTVDLTDDCGNTKLIYAAQNGYVEAVKLLIEYGAKIDHAGIYGNTALMQAAGNGHLDIVKMLLESGAQVDRANIGENESIEKKMQSFDLYYGVIETGGQTALIFAAQNDRVDVVKILLEHGASVDSADDDGHTALMYASQRGHVEVVKTLIENGAKIDQANIGMNGAAEYKNEHSVWIGDIDSGGRTALIFAAKEGHTEVVKLLLEYGAKANLADRNRASTALTYATHRCSTEIVKLLLEAETRDNSDRWRWGESFACAADDGCVEIVKLFLDYGIKCNAYGNDALMKSAGSGNIEIVKLILEREVNMDWTRSYLEIALVSAAGRGNTEIVKLLFENGAAVDYMSTSGNTALIEASSSFHERSDTVQLLLEYDASVDIAAGWREETALMGASRRGHVETIKMLLQNGADPHKKNKYGESAIDLAKAEGHQDCVTVLESEQIKFEKIENDDAALIQASKNGQREAVKKLLESGAKVNKAIVKIVVSENKGNDNNNHSLEQRFRKVPASEVIECGRETALIFASQNGHAEIVKLLLEYGALVELKDNNGNTALMHAAKNGHVEIVNMLLKKGAAVDRVNKYKWTAFMEAVEKGHVDAAKVLIEHGAKVDHNGMYGDTALMWASGSGNIEIVKMLLERGANIDLNGHNGRTALIEASVYNNFEIARMLIVHGATVDLAEWRDCTALMWAAGSDSVEAVKTLIEHGAKVDFADQRGFTALVWAAANGSIETVKTLIDCGATVDFSDRNDNTALMLAVANGYVEAVKLLFENGADPHKKNNQGASAIDIAKFRKRHDCVAVLEGK